MIDHSHYGQADRGRPPVIAVIGGGFSGAVTAASVLRLAATPAQIVLIESRALIGRGLAYSTGDSGHLLNVPAGKMGAFPDDIGGFHAWASSTLGNDDPGAFLPRKDYGRYIEGVLAGAATTAPPGVEFTRLRDAAIRAEPTRCGARVHLTSGDTIEADHVVLAIGSGPPKVPQSIAEIAHDAKRVITTPFAPNALEAVGRDDRLLVLGTGLTMYDAAISISRRGFSGEMVCVSRRGRVALPHRAHTVPAWAAEWAASVPSARSARALLRTVREAILRADAERLDWRGVIDSLRPHLPTIWDALPLPEREAFLRHVSPFWEVCRHRCAPEVWSTLSILSERGVTTALAGRVLRAEIRNGSVLATIRARGSSQPTFERFDRVLVCAGPETDVTRWNASLIRSLLSDGLIVPDPLRLGVRTSSDGTAVASNGAGVPWLSVVGPLRKATLWESTAVPELRTQAADAARRALERLGLVPCVSPGTDSIVTILKGDKP